MRQAPAPSSTLRQPGVPLSQMLVEKGLCKPYHPNSKVARALAEGGPQRTREFDRVLSIPRRVLDGTSVADLTDFYRISEGTMALWPLQSAALSEASRQDGLFAPLGVGAGKTLITLLLPFAMNSKKAVLLVPPQVRDQLISRMIPEYFQHFKMPLDTLRVVAYSELSSAKHQDILERLCPDLIIADECHLLRRRSSARTKRFLRFAKEHPECRFAFLSGTMTKRSILDYAHLIELALRKNSPLPNRWPELQLWAGALDPPVKDAPLPPGVLTQLCAAGEDVRSGYRRRLTETEGVVATEEGAIGTSLLILSRRVVVAPAVARLLDTVRNSWQLGDEEFEDAMTLRAALRQIAAGFYYEWEWPNGEKDYEWLAARRAWHRELREILKRGKAGMDSPLLVVRAMTRGEIEVENWAAWAAVKDRYRPTPPVRTVWVDDYLVDNAAKWAEETGEDGERGGILWTEHRALGYRLREKFGFPFFEGGDDLALLDAANDPASYPVLVCSIAAHGTGKNLQARSRMLVLEPPANGVAWEQLLGRLHRPGQAADTVDVGVFVHTEEYQRAFDQALADASFIEQTQGQRQKLLYATKVLS